MISFFIPKFFILVTASPFYAARRDKNGVRNVVRLSVISCRCEGRQSVASEAMLLAAMPRSFAAVDGLATENQSVLVLKGAFLSLLTVLLQGALHVLELERVDSWSSV